MKSTTFTSETSILVILPDDELIKFDDVTKVTVKGTTIYVHRNKFGYDDVVKLENVQNFNKYTA